MYACVSGRCAMRAASIAFYRGFEAVLVALRPAVARHRLPATGAAGGRRRARRQGFLFDCQMCGHCVLSSTGMSCPMNCPKQLAQRPLRRRARRWPLRSDPDMRCVWVEAVRGQPAHSRRRRSDAAHVQPAVDRRLQGSSSWLRVVREKPSAQPRVRFEDEPVPGYPLPILPGHTSPGRFERVLRAGALP